VTDPLLYARAIHFAASIMAAGVAFFVVLIAEPTLRKEPSNRKLPVAFYLRLAWIAWISLVIAILSGAAWLVLVASSMSGKPVSDMLSHGVLWTVLWHTDFGNDW
jgi:putative copper resistance protein D